MATTGTDTQRAEQIIADTALAEEELLDELENVEIPAHIREARIEAFKKQAEQLAQMKEKDHGQYTEITEEKKFLELTTQEDRCVIHFYHADFRRCAIMDTHLLKLSEKYFETKFAKINVDNAKFFVQKLKIKILPAVICFKKGVVIDRVIGFDDLGNTDSFLTSVLEKRLGSTGTIPFATEEKRNKTIFGFAKDNQGSDSDSDDDY